MTNHTTIDNCSIVDFGYIAEVRAGTSGAVTGLNFFFIVAAICRLAYKQYTFVYRHTENCYCVHLLHNIICNPFLWLAISSWLSSLSFSLSAGAVIVNDNASCKTAGYLTQAFESFENWMTLFFGVYFIIYVISNGKPLSDNHADAIGISSNCCYCGHGSIVLSFILILFVLSFVYNAPFVIEGVGGNYGNSGPWCWIEGMDTQIGFWYVLYWIVQVIVVICLIIAICILCEPKCGLWVKQKVELCGCECGGDWNKNFTVCLAVFLLIYYIIHFSFGIIESVVRLNSNYDCTETTNGSWIAYAVLTPISKLFLVGGACLFLTVQPLYSKQHMQLN